MIPFRRLFTLPFRTRDTIRRDVDDELDFHIGMRARELEASGMSAAEAREAARREFGDVENTRRALNETDRRIELRQRILDAAAEACQDARHALRQAVRAPLVTGVAAATLALGIGASTAIYSVVHGVLLAPLPWPEQDRVVTLHQIDGAADGSRVHLAPLNFADWKGQSRSFAHSAIAEPYGMGLTGRGTPVRLETWRVTEGFFEALGAAPLHGRWFLDTEHADGSGRFVVLGHAVWQARFAGDARVVGTTVVLDGEPHLVVGVAGPAFDFPNRSDLYVPRPLPAEGVGRGNRVSTYLRGVARLAPGVTLTQARAEADRIATELARLHPAANRRMGFAVTPLHEELTGRVERPLLVLLGAVLLVQLIACANVACLLLARGVRRHRELAVRAALGAGRNRLARQLMVEAAVLAGIALALGLVAGSAGLGVIRSLAPVDLPRLDDVGLGGPVVLFACALAAFTVLAAGLAPAVHQSRAEPGDAMRDGSAGAGARKLPGALLVAEVALTLMLLIGAGLLLRSHARLLREDLGFEPDRRLALTLHVWGEYPDPDARVRFFEGLIERLDAVPGVRSVAAANSLPLSLQGSEMDPPFTVEGAAAPETGMEPTAILTIVTPSYFEAMGIRRVAGRVFERRDDAAAPPVVLVNEALVRRHFAGVDPVGRRLVSTMRGQRRSLEIIGVIADVRHAKLDESVRPEIYVPLAQLSFGSMTLVVRTEEGAPVSLPLELQSALWSFRPGLIFDNLERLDVRLAETLAPRRFVLALVGIFASIAFALALVGIYGAVSFAVAQRTSEIGVRMALGAAQGSVVGMLVREGLGVVALGTLIGTAGAAGVTQLMSALLFGVSPFDPLTFAAIALVMLLTAAIAAWLPARRAARISPVIAMRT